MLSAAVFLLPAYQLRVCQPPPEVPNADMLMEDGELEIGECGRGNFSLSNVKSNTISQMGPAVEYVCNALNKTKS